MFNLRQVHDQAFGGIGDRYTRYIDPYHFLGRNAMDETLWSAKPKSNIRQTPDEYHIEIAVPGFSREEIALNLFGDRLVVECTKPDPHDKVPAPIHQEYGYNQISRTFIIPPEVDQDRIKSKYRQGILHIALPLKKKAKVTAKRIELT